MSGVKGRSGRRLNYQEIDIPKLLTLSYNLQMEYLLDPKVSMDKKVEYASRFLQKRVGEKIDFEVKHTLDNGQIDLLTQRCIDAMQYRNVLTQS